LQTCTDSCVWGVQYIYHVATYLASRALFSVR
jgi:hypothetical protein